MGESNKRQ